MKSSPLSSRTVRSSRAAFTLIELLTVIAIIGILAAIIIPVTGKVRESARAATCAANLRQIGFATGLYAEDNKGWLPGHTPLPGSSDPGLYGGQRAYYNNKPGQGNLSHFVASYLGYPAWDAIPSGENRILPPFLCPSWQAIRGSDGGKVFTLTTDLYGDQTWKKPFGEFGNTSPKNAAMRLTDIDTPSVRKMMWDASKTNDTDYIPQPAHGNKRNVLYFDWHVKSEKQ
jgi:prepilin-type N-terminal cleavage/methylation domain-containing protein/prepilin-type processing-associated H-X9-DG protein